MVEGRAGRLVGLGLLTLGYVFGEIAHFLMATTSRDVARDIQYGDQACLQRSNSSGLAAACSGLGEEACGELAQDCEWQYNGQGYQFQVLVGPAFVATFSTTLLFMGVAADNFNRPLVFAIGTLIFSVSCFLTGFAEEYWHLVATRVGIALGEAACRPTASSLLADMFQPENMAVVNGIFSWGVYFGYALAFLFGLKMTDANLFDYGWRAAYILPGAAGVLLAFLIPFLIKDPRSKLTLCCSKEGEGTGKEQSGKTWGGYFKALLAAFSQPEMLLLLTAAIFRHMAGLSWANNNVNFFNEYHPDYDIGYWLFACSIAGGSVGVLAGGLVTDLLKRRMGPHSRLWIQALFLAAATPFAALTLHLDPPYCFICLMAYYFCAETWFAILFTVIVEIVPAETRAFCVGVFLFMMNMVAGNLAVLVKTAGESIGLREAMYVFFPGFVAVCSIFFFLAGIPIFLRNRRAAPPS